MKIPKLIHQIWVGHQPIPPIFQEYMKTWRKHHPEWKFLLWTDKNIPELIHQDLYDSAKEVVLKANMLRIELLYRFGGVYVDMDFECYKPIDPLLNGVDVFSCGEEEGVIGNAIIGGTPHHPTWLKLMKGWAKSIEKNSEYPPTIQAGVVYITKTLNKEKDIYLFPSKYFFPTVTETNSPMGMDYYFPEAYANHHWAASWVTKETQKKWVKWVKKTTKGKKWYE